MYQLIDIVKEKFGDIPEILFWEIYINWRYVGNDPQIKLCEKLIEETDYLEPYFHLFNHALHTDGFHIERLQHYYHKAHELFEIVKDQSTCRKRIVCCYLEPSIKEYYSKYKY